MGKQVNFYMNPDDEEKVVASIAADLPELLILKSEMDQQRLEFLKPNELQRNIEKEQRVLIARQSDIDEIKIESPIQLVVPPYNIRNIVDSFYSPVIEFDRCIKTHDDEDGKRIYRGRLYYIERYFDIVSGQKETKNSEFISFAKKVFLIFKRNLTLNKEEGNYYGEGALYDQKNGWILF
jgi:hypothetical protein